MSLQSQIDFLIEEYDQLKKANKFLLIEYGEKGAKPLITEIAIKMASYDQVIQTLSNLRNR